jgi:hypothetical protein
MQHERSPINACDSNNRTHTNNAEGGASLQVEMNDQIRRGEAGRDEGEVSFGKGGEATMMAGVANPSRVLGATNVANSGLDVYAEPSVSTCPSA